MQLHGKKHDSYIGYPTVQNTPVSKDFCQESLTKLVEKILNRDTYLNSTKMKLGNIGSSLAAAAALSLSGCANAQETTGATTQAPEAVALTRAECLAMEVKDAKIACLLELRGQRQTQIAALDEEHRANQAEIATLDATIEGQEETIRSIRAETAEARTTNEGLRDEINQIFQEESELGG